MRVGLHAVLLLTAFDIINDQLSFVVDSRDVANADWRGLEGSRFQTELFLPFGDEREAASVQLVNVEDALRVCRLAEKYEARALGDPAHLEGREREPLVGMLDNLWCLSRVHLNFKFFFILI